ncbi:MAG: hypothetical protein BAJALOKI3v1_230002 [Promethearchaeota archaeon]|nr:MAG: hypothetical protein BAJALOKI3v1_230002 [Candidatus Lokiarchaeota archaeon]
MKNSMHISQEQQQRLKREAEEILDMVEGFGLLCQEPHESDKKAFISNYIEYRLAQ